MRKLRGKTALVTGAASGIGRSISVQLAAEGVHLFLLDINEVGLATVVGELQGAGVEVISRRCDVAEPREVSATVAEILSRWNGVDILVNNAGISYYGRTERMSAEHWDKLIRVNLLAHIQFTRELLPSLLARPEAHVLNVCSMFGLVGMPKLAAYTTTKFAMVGFSDSLRAEYGRDGLGVTALCPGFVDTNLFASAPLGESQNEPKIPPVIFCTTPRKVARAAVKAIRRDRRLVVISPWAKFLVTMKRIVPGAMDFLFHLGRRKRVARKVEELKRAA
ncbi:MAG TPA: SDR family oxidoreductase [Lacipirellulaceae bacterium]|jgi:short-subunit dehydrogenase|nr:SDR family oxidoreductase [Lacipirellulaceae bacterium]